MEYIKQSMNDIWAAAGDVVMPEEAKIAEGWLVEVPPRQYWNWMQNRTDVNLAYIFQRGVPEWDISVEYLANKSFVVYNGIIYKSILTGVGKNPESQTSYWVRAFRDWSAIGQAVDGLTPAADRFVYYTGASTAALATVTSFARSILDDTSAADVRTTIGAQASDATLTAVAGVTTAANKLIYFTGVDTAAATDLSAFGRSLIDDANASAARTTLGLASGATTDVGTMATQNANSVSITGGSITGITDLAITDGGTGASTAEGARSNLGLGTAAIANVTTSNTDTTAGRLMAVGAFGVGGDAVFITDPDTAYRPSGMYDVGPDVTWPNRPPVGGYTRLLHISHANPGGYATQYATAAFEGYSNRHFYRVVVNGTWTPWVELFHTGNQLSLGTTPAEAQTALGLGTAATATLTTNNLDTAPGRVLRVGDFGTGVSIPLSNVDINTFGVWNASYYVSSGINTPSSTNGWLVHMGITPDFAMQSFYNVSGNGVYTRRKFNGVWQSWREVYNQAGILGTVSQSGGVPTGAIIERGSNANGEYVRFADGTQICIVYKTVPVITSAVGGGFECGTQGPFNYPAAWLDIPSAGFSSDNENVLAGVLGSTLTFYFNCFTFQPRDYTTKVQLLFIGRWC